MFKNFFLFIIAIILILTINIYINKDGFKNDKHISIEPLKQYAINLQYCTNKNETSCFTLPEVPPEVENVLKNRIIDDEYKAYVSLIFLKISSSQVKHFKQSYAFREPFTIKMNPLEKAFKKFGKSVMSEFNTTDIGYQWICVQKQYLDNYPIISQYCSLMDKEYNQIEN
jgi:transposase